MYAPRNYDLVGEGLGVLEGDAPVDIVREGVPDLDGVPEGVKDLEGVTVVDPVIVIIS